MAANSLDTDAVVIGTGVVGLACARTLAARGFSVVALERHGQFGVETSSRNSEVVHAGIYYPPGSLKATLCVRGNPSLYAWCRERSVPHRRVGKLIVATRAAEESTLAGIMATAQANGVSSLIEWTSAQAREAEPHVRATAALWSPDTGIVDSHAFMASLLADAQSHRAAFAWHHALIAVDRCDGGYRLTARAHDGEETAISARWVVNSAGLDADVVAAMAGLDVEACALRLHYARGHYFRVHPRKSHLARHLIYPVPVPGGLGIHVTLDLTGGIRLGPDVQYLETRIQDYAIDESLRSPFFAAVSRYLDGLEPDDLTPDQSGIRPKLQAAGGPFRDFVIAEESARGLPGWVNLVGMESPGLTCALEVGTTVARLLEGR